MQGRRGSERLPFLTGGGEMLRRVRAFDWGASPLGEPDGWCPELVTAVSFVLESQIPAALVWGAEMLTIHNDAFLPLLGEKGDVLGRSFREIWAEAWHEIGPIAERAYAGSATFIEDFPLTVERFGHPEQAYFTFCYSPLRLADGTVAGMIDTVVETTRTVEARNRSALLNGELGHRYQNAIALVQAIAHQSLRDVTERDAVRAFQDRLRALGQANEMLLATSWTGSTVGDVAATLLPLHGGGGRFRLTGPVVPIGPRTALSLSLLLHELATNAVKHGALGAGGTVAVGWTIEGDALRIVWTEEGGPPAREGSRRGFGSRIIAMGLGGASHAETRYGDDGFAAEFRTPVLQIAD